MKLETILTKLAFDLPIQTVSEANGRQNWRDKSKRRQAQQSETAVILKNALKGRRVALPCTVKITRVSCKLMDGDNLQNSIKGIRDILARTLGVDDGDPRIKFEYDQELVKQRLHNLRVQIISQT